MHFRMAWIILHNKNQQYFLIIKNALLILHIKNIDFENFTFLNDFLQRGLGS